MSVCRCGGANVADAVEEKKVNLHACLLLSSQVGIVLREAMMMRKK